MPSSKKKKTKTVARKYPLIDSMFGVTYPDTLRLGQPHQHSHAQIYTKTSIIKDGRMFNREVVQKQENGKIGPLQEKLWVCDVKTRKKVKMSKNKILTMLNS